MDRLEDLSHNAEYEEAIARYLNEGFTIEEADELYAEEMEHIRELRDQAFEQLNEAMS